MLIIDFHLIRFQFYRGYTAYYDNATVDEDQLEAAAAPGGAREDRLPIHVCILSLQLTHWYTTLLGTKLRNASFKVSKPNVRIWLCQTYIGIPWLEFLPSFQPWKLMSENHSRIIILIWNYSLKAKFHLLIANDVRNFSFS